MYERAIREIYGPFKRLLQKRAPSEEEEEVLQMLISVAEKYDVPSRIIVPLLIPFVVRGQPLTESDVLSFSALTVSRLAHAREEFRETKSSLYRSAGNSEGAKEIVYKIWQIPNDG